MNRRVLKWALIFACLLALRLPGYSSPEYRAVTVLYTNDTHDHLIPFSYPDPENPRLAYAQMPVRKDIGGIARRATLVKRIKAETHGNALLMDAGDVVEGTPFGLEYDGRPDYEAMAAVGYDAAVPGNHDFRFPLAVFRAHMVTIPHVCANLLDRKTGKPELPEYRIFTFGGAKIAVFGLTVMSPEYPAAKEGLDFTDPYDAAAKLVPELRKQADVVIALTHLGAGEDEALAKRVQGIDVIVGGHSHTRYATPKFVPTGIADDPFAINGTLIVQAYEHGVELGRLDLRLRKDGGRFTVMGYSGKLIPITSDIPDDSKTAKIVAKYYKPLAKTYGRVIGEATDTFFTFPAVLNLVCDSMREASGADVAIYGVGAVRGDLVKGPLRAWDVATAIPYANKIQLLDMTGEQVKQILIRFPVKPGVSGMKYRMVGADKVEGRIARKPIDDKAVYKVATIDWLVGLYFKGYPVTKTLDITARDSIVNYIKARKTVTPDKEDRKN